MYEMRWMPRHAAVRPDEAGWTLIELMIVVVIIGVLASVGLPYFRSVVLKGNVTVAQPYLMHIASKERIYKMRTGRYYFSKKDEEQDLEDVLGVDLKDAGDFCFMVVCMSTCTDDPTSLKSATSSGSYITSAEGSETIDFEVWGVLRKSPGDASGGPNGKCKVADEKLDPKGWVVSGNRKGSAGRVVVLRHPPPPDGYDSVSGHDGRRYDWSAGITLSDALID